MVEHVIRTKDGGTKKVNMSRDTAIKLMCSECMGWEAHPKECSDKFCPLYPYRGKKFTATRADVTEVVS